MAGRGRVLALGGSPPLWAVRFEARDSLTGRLRTLHYSKYPSKQAAERQRRSVAGQLADGSYFAPAEGSVGEYLVAWLTRQRGARASTRRQYAALLDRYVLPVIGARPLEKLRPVDIEAMLAPIIEAGHDRTAAYTFTVLKAAMRDAVRNRALQWNPCDGVDAPRSGRKTTPPVLSEENLRQLVNAAEGDAHGALWLFLAGTGCRPSEALALRWESLDLAAGNARIEAGLGRDEAGALVRLATKTDASVRTLVLPATVTKALASHKVRQAAMRLKAGPVWVESGLIFTTGNGTPLDPRNVRRYWMRFCRMAGLPVGRLYSLRHSVATHLLRAGRPVLGVARALGHARPTMTLNVYGHVIAGDQQVNAETLDKVLGGVA